MISNKLHNFKLESDQRIFEREIRKVDKGTTYKISTEFIGINGTEYIACFGIGTPYDKIRLKNVKVRWLNDFTSSLQRKEIIFQANSNEILIFYRINAKTPVVSNCHYKLLPIKEIKISEIKSSEETYDEPEFFQVQKPEELSPDEENQLEKNLVWIFASPRSGTTWLGIRLLKGKFFSIDEPKIGTHIAFNKLDKGIIDSASSTVYNFNVKEEDSFLSDQYEKTWKVFLRKMILNRIYAQIRDVNQKIIIKEPNGTMGAETISRCLPNSKIIILLRDGRDVIDSYVDAFTKDGWLARRSGTSLTSSNRMLFIEQQAKRWNNFIRILLKIEKNHTPENCLMIKYEDLKENTKEILEKIYQFLQIKISKGELEKIIEKNSYKNIPTELKGKGKAIRSATSGQWKEHFTKEEVEMMNNIMNEMLTKTDYK